MKISHFAAGCLIGCSLITGGASAAELAKPQIRKAITAVSQVKRSTRYNFLKYASLNSLPNLRYGVDFYVPLILGIGY